MSNHAADASFNIVFAFVFFLVLVILSPFTRKKCPACGKRGARFQHQRQDGQRDRRYSYNPLVCPLCGYIGPEHLVAPHVAHDPGKSKPERSEAVLPPIIKTQRAKLETQIPLFAGAAIPGELPPLSLLDEAPPQGMAYSEETLEVLSRQIEFKLQDLKIVAKVVGAYPGPVITRFELELGAGVRSALLVNSQTALADALNVKNVRIVEIIPGKNVVGLEIPNTNKQIVYLSEILRSEKYEQLKSPVALALGKDIGGKPVVVDLAKMPHLLVAGTTGSGKSVAVNAMVLSLLYKASSKDVRMIMIDPKMLELSVYEGIPHLLAPVVTDMKEAANALRWCVAEMERRYKLMAAVGVRNLGGFNKKVKDAENAGQPLLDPLFRPMYGTPSIAAEQLEPLPYIVIVLDAYLDQLIIETDHEDQLSATQLLQLLVSRSAIAGIHLICTALPFSVQKTSHHLNFSAFSRSAFHLSSERESLEIFGQVGCDLLESQADMLYRQLGSVASERVHNAFVGEQEEHQVVAWLRSQGAPQYIDGVLEGVQAIRVDTLVADFGLSYDDEAQAVLYDKAVAIVTQTRRASISGVQRHLRIGYNRAARLVEQMEADGVVSAPQHNGNREVLAPPPPKN
jgi:S-DNA-T family DNA segregation ATPase FtsK/SpoIIIE